jgi:hypothetical protein
MQGLPKGVDKRWLGRAKEVAEWLRWVQARKFEMLKEIFDKLSSDISSGEELIKDLIREGNEYL